MATNKRIIRSNDEAAAGGDFNTVVWTGDGSTGRDIDVGFSPDLVWIKNRDTTYVHLLYDTIRGTLSRLSSNLTNAEADVASSLTSFNENGFTVGSYGGVNNSGQDLVAWCWKAGGAAVTNTDGTITSQVSANTEAGFSVVSYTGNGTGSSTIGHGLGAAPSIILIKGRSLVSDWNFFYNIDGSSNRLYLNTTGADTDFAPMTSFSSSTINLPSYNSSGWNQSSDTYIAYCFAEVAGFSKFGSYVGNGANANFISTSVGGDGGFEPAFLLIKQTTAARNWYIMDNKRNPTNPKNLLLIPNSSGQEFAGVGDTFVDFLSNGFEITEIAGDAINQSGQTYIYMAFANQF